MKFAFILAILMVASGASLIGRAMNSGSPNVEGKKMPAYGKKLSEQLINALVAFPKP